MELEGRTALLTGAAGGIGGYIARSLAAEGAGLALSDHPDADLDPLVEELRDQGARVESVTADLANSHQLGRLPEEAEARLGPIDILINNAGLDYPGSFLCISQDELDAIVAVNLLAVMKLTRAVLPGMRQRGRGHIVNVASVAGKVFAPYLAAYAATKHGVVGFTHSLRAEYGSKPVGFSAVCLVAISRVGMFGRVEHQVHERRFPFKPRSPEQVGEAVIKSIRRNQAELFVGNPTLRLLAVACSSAPGLSTWLAKFELPSEAARELARIEGRLEQ